MTETKPTDPTGIKQCCANVYGSDSTRYLLGESFHLGGLELTEELASLLVLGPDSLVLDVASGKGTTALFLFEQFGCRVIGVDLNEQKVTEASAEVASLGLSAIVRSH